MLTPEGTRRAQALAAKTTPALLARESPPAKLRARPRTGFGLLGFGDDIVVGFDDHGDGVPEHLGHRRKIAGVVVQIF